MAKKQLTIVFLSMEMMMPELGEPACGANFKGGLGIFSGDTMAGFARLWGELGIRIVAFVPLYHRHYVTREVIHYEKTSAEPILDGEERQFGLQKIYRINRGGADVFGLEKHDTFDFIYTEDRRQRLRQEILMGKAPIQILKRLGIRPDILWINESHTALAIPEIKEDPYLEGAKVLFTIHTPEQAGMEKFYDFRFDDLKINPDKYQSIFARRGVLDLTWAAMELADMVNAVSDEHAEVVKRFFPQFALKIVGIRNGSDREFWLSPRIKLLGENFSAEDLERAHQSDRDEAIAIIEQRSRIKLLDKTKPTIWWVRRLAEYKNQYPMLKDIIWAVCADRGSLIDTELGRLEGLGMNMVCAGRCAETDNTCLWWMEKFFHWANTHPNLHGKFIFLPEYDVELLKIGAQGCDIWLCTPQEKREACGTSDQRAMNNGNPVVTTRTGGPKEYGEEFNSQTGRGNVLFISPYEPLTLYKKLKVLSDLWYAWRDNGNSRWLQLKMNAFLVGKTLDITLALKRYKEEMLDELMRSQDGQ